MFLVNSRLGVVSATIRACTPPVPLIPKLRGYFAEFLHHDSLDRLGILYLSTCVGLGYGRLTTRSRRFSWQHRITEFDHTVYASCFRIPARRIYLSDTLHTYPGTTITRYGYLPASLRSLSTTRSDHRLDTPQTRRPDKISRVLSITRLNTDVVPPVREYQPVVHRLRLSASP